MNIYSSIFNCIGIPNRILGKRIDKNTEKIVIDFNGLSNYYYF